ncbi:MULTISPECIES: hypothetical protein [Mameliella]|uniref:hypothetical protein n=1 Tax=Mameliella TaxID=1434019 RepID=UPI001054A128|nr:MULTISPECIES: hypothetical protein [Mameliella]MBY6121843.1 hypothetical protein [Mameliella alba]MCR9272851.1 hypothetical protein [Paracoccaceae bacterium]
MDNFDNSFCHAFVLVAVGFRHRHFLFADLSIPFSCLRRVCPKSAQAETVLPSNSLQALQPFLLKARVKLAAETLKF